MSRFSLIVSVDNMMVCEPSKSRDDMLKEMAWRGVRQFNVLAIWSEHARRGEVMCDGNTAILCTSGKRAICGRVIMSGLMALGESQS